VNDNIGTNWDLESEFGVFRNRAIQRHYVTFMHYPFPANSVLASNAEAFDDTFLDSQVQGNVIGQVIVDQVQMQPALRGTLQVACETRPEIGIAGHRVRCACSRVG
jgi:hypothetical protein